METCQICGKSYGYVWKAPDRLWRKVMNRYNEGGLACIPCFDDKARYLGYTPFWECGDHHYPTDNWIAT